MAGYVDSDKAKKQQKSLPLSVFRKLYENDFTPMDEAMGQLACGAFFFGMRSCEYLAVAGKKEKNKTVEDQEYSIFQKQRRNTG